MVSAENGRRLIKLGMEFFSNRLGNGMAGKSGKNSGGTQSRKPATLIHVKPYTPEESVVGEGNESGGNNEKAIVRNSVGSTVSSPASHRKLPHSPTPPPPQQQLSNSKNSGLFRSKSLERLNGPIVGIGGYVISAEKTFERPHGGSLGTPEVSTVFTVVSKAKRDAYNKMNGPVATRKLDRERRHSLSSNNFAWTP